jgi:ADP-ribose pyrophosphatase YjhB (NUDIX family)
MPFEQVLGTLLEFRGHFERCVAQNKELKEAEERKAKREVRLVTSFMRVIQHHEFARQLRRSRRSGRPCFGMLPAAQGQAYETQHVLMVSSGGPTNRRRRRGENAPRRRSKRRSWQRQRNVLPPSSKPWRRLPPHLLSRRVEVLAMTATSLPPGPTLFSPPLSPPPPRKVRLPHRVSPSLCLSLTVSLSVSLTVSPTVSLQRP